MLLAVCTEERNGNKGREEGAKALQPLVVGHGWDSINLEHAMTFETLAMEPELKKVIVDDLHRFVRRKDLYKRVGRAWKRGYFLYGPPGTGKTSLIAAVANYLKFDIYDLQLGSLMYDSDINCSFGLLGRGDFLEDEAGMSSKVGTNQQVALRENFLSSEILCREVGQFLGI
ncbi:hypothetical protein Ancab_003234 [Ancistrocladus abbreviatus]